MADQPIPKTGSSKSGFLREGWRELGRKLARRKLRKQTTQQGRERSDTLARLGQRACEAGIDLSDFAELRDQIRTLEARVSELAATTSKLQSEQAALEEKRRAETARFDAQRRAVDDLKRPVDTALREATQKQSAQEREIKRIEARIAAIAGERLALEKQAAAAPGQPPQAADQAKLQQIRAEQSQLSTELPNTQQILQSLAPEINRLTADSQRYSNEITKVEAERKATLAQIDESLTRLRGELQTTRQQTEAATQERQNRFVQLGQGLYEKKKDEPMLAEQVHQVAEVEQRLGGTAASLRSSLAETQAMPRGTMAKFVLTLVGTPLVIIGLIYGAYLTWEYTRPDERVETRKPVNRYLQHALSGHPAYVLANQLVEAKSEQEVAERMREAFQKIHLGIYTHDGRQILAGAERSEKDLFLYDFQWKILARAFFLRNGMGVAAHTRMLGKALLELENPAELEPVLATVIAQRYQEAREKPDDPMSFIILLVDGLARQQVEPYSIEETHRYSNDRIFFDPIQSFLIMLDFFTHPPAPKATSFFRLIPSFVTTAYAQGPCDGILGDEGQGYWGRGMDILTEAAAIPQWAGKKAVEVFGNVTGVAGAIGDLLVLYGMTIKLTPEPEVMHLVHDADFPVAVEALVTFDSQGVPDAVLKCGWLVAKQMPANGPVKGVELKWDFRPPLDAELKMHGEMWYGPGDRRTMLTYGSGLRTTTNEDGKSIFLIQRDKCPDPRGRRIVTKPYVAIVNARYVTTSIPTPGASLGWGLVLKMGPGGLEFLMNGRSASVPFRSEWHEKKPKQPQY